MRDFDDIIKWITTKVCGIQRRALNEVYDMGFADGKKFVDDKIDKWQDAYQQGLKEAWELARKIVNHEDDIRNCFWDIAPAEIFERYTASEAKKQIKEYEDIIKKRIKEYEDRRATVKNEELYTVQLTDAELNRIVRTLNERYGVQNCRGKQSDDWG